MSDIFISYARADRAKAGLLATALSERGWTVWWDREILPGTAYEDVISEEISASKCVIVLWSKNAIASHWVRAEANEGIKRGMLLPINLDGSEPPLSYRQVQTADLSRWPEERRDESFSYVVRAVSRIIDKQNEADQASASNYREKNTKNYEENKNRKLLSNSSHALLSGQRVIKEDVKNQLLYLFAPSIVVLITMAICGYLIYSLDSIEALIPFLTPSVLSTIIVRLAIYAICKNINLINQVVIPTTATPILALLINIPISRDMQWGYFLDVPSQAAILILLFITLNTSLFIYIKGHS
jgi:hypothetical protein